MEKSSFIKVLHYLDYVKEQITTSEDINIHQLTLMKQSVDGIAGSIDEKLLNYPEEDLSEWQVEKSSLRGYEHPSPGLGLNLKPKVTNGKKGE